MGKKAEKNHGKVRREKRTIKEQLNILLNLPITDEKQIEHLKNMGFETEELNNQLLITNSLFEKAVAGDTSAIKTLVGLLQNEDTERKSRVIDDIDSLFEF
jgi:hypothetical protein